MRICILNIYNEPIAYIDNDVKGSLHYHDDTIHAYLKGSANTFSFSCGTDHDDVQHLTVGNKVAFVYDGKSYFNNIMKVIQTETEITVETWSLSFELLNEIAPAYTASKAMSFLEYVNAFDFCMDDMEIGINEISDRSRTLEWTSETDTILERLYSLATQFDAEIEFVPVLTENYALSKITMNIYKEHDSNNQGVGQKRTDLSLRYGYNISGITKTVDITSLTTCIYATGADDITISSVDSSKIYDDDGELLYYHDKGTDKIFAPKAAKQFPPTLNASSDKWLLYRYSTNAETPAKLYSLALEKLKELSQPEITYEIDGKVNANIGDTVTIIDEAFKPPLYVECRVSEQSFSTTDNTQGSTTFTNINVLEV